MSKIVLNFNMDFPFGFGQKSSLLLIFFFNGLLFSLVLLKRGIFHENQSQKWLSFLLFLCALYIAPYMLGYAGWYSRTTTREILFFVPFMQVLVIGPVVYFYVQSLLKPDFQFHNKDWWHFTPGIIYLLYSLVIFISDKFIFEEFYFYADGRDKDLKTWYQLLGLTSMISYLFVCLRMYLRYKKSIFDVVSFAESVLYRWIQNFLIAFLTLLVLRIIFFFTNPQWEEFGSQFWYFLSFSAVFLYISINGYAHSLTSESFAIQRIPNPIPDYPSAKSVSKKEDIDCWKSKIETLMNTQSIYQNPQLTLTDVAEALGTNSKMISNVINQGFQMNFNDFINYHRIEAIKKKIGNGEHLKSTLLGLAIDCGFNSKATFNRAFKKSTSLTPKDYISQLK